MPWIIGSLASLATGSGGGGGGGEGCVPGSASVAPSGGFGEVTIDVDTPGCPCRKLELIMGSYPSAAWAAAIADADFFYAGGPDGTYSSGNAELQTTCAVELGGIGGAYITFQLDLGYAHFNYTPAFGEDPVEARTWSVYFNVAAGYPGGSTLFHDSYTTSGSGDPGAAIAASYATPLFCHDPVEDGDWPSTEVKWNGSYSGGYDGVGFDVSGLYHLGTVYASGP